MQLDDQKYLAGFKKECVITVDRPDFDAACRAAAQYAARLFGADRNGYFNNVKDNERTTDSICIEFEAYTMHGQNHDYVFQVWVSRTNDDD